ncbi:gamma-glutamylcyclotransferase [Stappia sp. GBMRC 2046]|uniref:Gamma-glutamylcyclotransferase n=1 Tax=Stappia sediminis TaxID=2692190 RepID=A0A7X3S6Q5_9HYPH|nr:gamma-glutamylcyclotransferase family protein [Stappia sediminis]MXN64111.1 gamma-glutamylcyclotransferase [Stappia sediminis]
MPIYFAYGSNMHRGQMSTRCPSGTPLGPARLAGWRFIITSDGVASIIPRPGSTVHGILWNLTLAHIRTLDRYEGVARGWYEKAHLPVKGPDAPVRALVYVGSNRDEGRPRPDYHSGIVIPAAREWELPATYLAELESWTHR